MGVWEASGEEVAFVHLFRKYLSAYYLPSTILDAAWMNMTLFGDKHILDREIVIKSIPFEVTAELVLSSYTH